MRGTAPAGSAEMSRRTKSWVLGANAMVVGSGKARMAATPRCARDELAEDRFPFVVGEPRGVGERAAMGLARRVRPKMMAVRRQMNTPRLRRAELGEMPAQIERHHALGLAAY